MRTEQKKKELLIPISFYFIAKIVHEYTTQLCVKRHSQAFEDFGYASVRLSGYIFIRNSLLLLMPRNNPVTCNNKTRSMYSRRPYDTCKEILCCGKI
jgi:hypothetical protein